MDNAANKEKFHWKIIPGILISLIDIWWIYDNLYLLYCYHYKMIFYFFMYPDWVLIINSIIGLIGLAFGISLTIGKGRAWIVILINILLWITGGLIKNIII